MDNDIPFFLNTFDLFEPEYKDNVWKFTLLGGDFIGKVIWLMRDANGHPIMITIEDKYKKIIEIPWTAIQCITYEGTK